MHTPFTSITSVVLLLSLSCLLGLFPHLALAATPLGYQLKVSFVPDEHLLLGKATIEIPAGEGLSLHLDTLSIDSAVLLQEGREIAVILPSAPSPLQLSPESMARSLRIHYHKTIHPGSPDNLLNQQGITLTDHWHPLPLQKMLFQLEVELPQGFSAISETDLLPLKQSGTVRFSFSQPVRAIHLAAGPYMVGELKIRDDLSLSTWFFKEDQALSQDYLASAARHIQEQEKLSPFPYRHYAIVANRLPSGLGMPTFTLLGQQVLRLPFIKDTALRHEVVHSWFGNGIDVALDSGNWAEGLTTFLAELDSSKNPVEATEQRKQAIIKYLSHVHPDTAIGLQDFHSPGHHQPLAEAIRAVGYQRGAMLFHELRLRLGETLFNQGLHRFVDNHLFQSASWQDMENSFTAVSDEDLAPFFQQYLNRQDLPQLTVSQISSKPMDGASRLSFVLEQQTERPYDLVVPLMIRTGNQDLYFQRRIDQAQTTITLDSPDPAVELIIDPEHDLLRQLNLQELPPVWSRFLGAPHKTVIVADGQLERFTPLLERFSDDKWQIIADSEASNNDLNSPALLFLGSDSRAYRSIFGPPATPTSQTTLATLTASPSPNSLAHQGAGFSLDVRQHPLQPHGVAVIMESQSTIETQAATAKLSHYGRYSSLAFNQGRNSIKDIQPAENGMRFQLETEPMGGSVSLSSLQSLMDELVQKRVIYVGERHDSMADHRLQFRIIQGLHRLDPDLVIGMEMFPQSSQPALDAYIQGSIDEQEFLKSSRYFEVWRYDWRFFREIFNYARRHQIRVMGLNLDRAIVSQLFKDGHSDNLAPAIQAALPPERDLNLPGYSGRLQQIHGMHDQGMGNVSGFIQAQGLWDETMAQVISDTLANNPLSRMVVLAGSQHTRPDSGIPPRVARRLNIPQATIINLYNDGLPADLSGFTDYFILAGSITMKPTGKIGVVLEENEEGPGLHIREISPLGKAGAAGIREGDILLAISNYPLNDMNDIRIALLDGRPGDLIQITVLRENGKEEERTVELSSLKQIKPHP